MNRKYRDILLFIGVPLLLAILFLSQWVFKWNWAAIGGAEIVVSFVTSILTYLYVVLTWRILRNATLINEEERRPYVIASIIRENNSYNFAIKNIGRLPASKVLFKVSPTMFRPYGLITGLQPIWDQPILNLPPNDERRYPIARIDGQFVETAPESFEVVLTYHCVVLKRDFKEEYPVDWPDLVAHDRKILDELLQRVTPHQPDRDKTRDGD